MLAFLNSCFSAMLHNLSLGLSKLTAMGNIDSQLESNNNSHGSLGSA